MDLESELRQAMAEHVELVSAPGSLAAAVRRRHRRRVTRIRVTVTVAAVTATVAAVVPAYQASRAMPVGTPSSRAGVGPANASVTPMPTFGGGSRYPSATPSNPGATSGTLTGTAPSRGRAPGARGPVPWVTYLPPGLTQAGPCVMSRAVGRSTTICHWAGGDGALVEIHLIDDAALAVPTDLVSAAPVETGRVHGRPAIVTDQPGAGGQVTWIERPGLGVSVTVSAPLRNRLLRIADGVRP
jgi:hypothetical protein